MEPDTKLVLSEKYYKIIGQILSLYAGINEGKEITRLEVCTAAAHGYINS